MKNKRLIQLTLILLMFTSSGTAYLLYRQSKFTSLIENSVENTYLKKAHWGLIVQELDTLKPLMLQNGNKNFIPASITKLFTTAAALHILGSEFRFETEVLAEQLPDDNGTLIGNIIIKASGDPALTSKSLGNLATQIKNSGVQRIEGKLGVKGFKYDEVTLPPHAEWEDLVWYYAPELHALSLSGNSIPLTISPAEKPGLPAQLRLDEEIQFFSIINLTVTTASNPQQNIPSLSISRGLSNNQLVITGTIPIGHEAIQEKIALHNPTEYAKRIFIHELHKAGITFIESETQPSAASPVHQIALHLSPPLSEIIQIINKESFNLGAELLIQATSYRCDENASPAEIQAGKPTFRYLSSLIRKVDEPYSLNGGAGISRHNMVTPSEVIELLQYMYVSEYKEPFVASLPIAGVDGTLAGRFTESIAENNLTAKTGSLSGVANMAGYATTKSGKKVCFCFFVDHFCGEMSNCKKEMENVIVSLLENL